MQLITPTTLVYFFHLVFRISHSSGFCYYFTGCSNSIPFTDCFSSSGSLTFGMAQGPVLRLLIFIHFFGNLIQSNGFKYHLYAADSQICISSPDLSFGALNSCVQLFHPTFPLDYLTSICRRGKISFFTHHQVHD